MKTKEFAPYPLDFVKYISKGGGLLSSLYRHQPSPNSPLKQKEIEKRYTRLEDPYAAISLKLNQQYRKYASAGS